MQYLWGCLGLILIIALIVAIVTWLFQNIVGLIGIAIGVWGIYEWNKNRKLGAKSKTPAIFVLIGLIITIGWFSFSGNEKEMADKKQNSTKQTASDEDNKTNDAADKEAEDAEKLAATKKANEEQIKQEAVKKQQEELAKKYHLEIATVASVVDGDTIELSDGRKVRLIGVNTPESTTRTEQYGKEASNYTKSKLEGKQVYLQKDVSETDRYGRLLRIVWVQVPTDDMNENEIRSKMFNANLVINGYAEPSTYPPDVKYSDYFVKFAREAREKNTGLWAFGENGTTKGDLDPKEVVTTPPAPKNNTGNNSSSAPAPSSSGGSEYFQNCTEMRKVYPNGVPSDHPAYAPKHDRDKDNWACER